MSRVFNDYHRIYIPINIRRVHWTQMVLHLDTIKIVYYDSIDFCHADTFCNAMMQYLKDLAEQNGHDSFVVDEFEIVKVQSCPKQGNGHDCGIFVLINTYLLVYSLPLRYG